MMSCFLKNILKLNIFLLFCIYLSTSAKIGFSNNYQDFVANVDNKITGQENKKQVIGRLEDGSDFDFAGTLQANYESFANNRYQKGDFIDAYYFKTKAEKIKNYKIISPANPYSFGILPDDMEQFSLAREQLRNVSINSIINSNDGLVLADSYIAFDCWIEAFEEGNALERVQRCRNRFLDNMKAMRVSLLMQGYSIFDMTNKENMLLNNRYSTCESCVLYNKGQYCNSIYFDFDEAKLMDKMNIVIKRLEKKLSYFSSATITILYYSNAYGYNKKLSEKRIDVAKNLVYNIVSKDIPVKPIVKIIPIKLTNDLTTKKIYRDAITICVSGNE